MGNVTIPRPGANDYAPFQSSYVENVVDTDVLEVLARREMIARLQDISESQSQHRYALGKWSIREVVGHVNDAERVFSYRALSFARGDASPLPGFDENAWGSNSNAGRRTLADLIEDLSTVRSATLALFQGFGKDELTRAGTASGHRVTVSALAYIIAGHERHHLRILKERYLSG